MQPSQRERRERLLRSFDRAIEQATKKLLIDTNASEESKEMQYHGIGWLKTHYGSFKAESDLHDARIVEFLKAHGLKDAFSSDGVKTLGDLLNTPLTRLKKKSEEAGRELPYAIVAIHEVYSQTPNSSAHRRQSWFGVVPEDSSPSA